MEKQEAYDWQILEAEVMADHDQFVLEEKPKVRMHSVVGKTKGNSS